MRAFVAVEITECNIHDAIRDVQRELEGRHVGVAGMHFTLQFLGEISESLCSEVKTALGTVRFCPFQISLVGVGAFPSPRSPRVIWVGVDDEGGRELVDLAGRVRGALAPLGLREERPFKPHVTILRRPGRVRLAGFTKRVFGAQEVLSFKLKKSLLTPTGPIYSDLLEVGAQ